MDRLTSQKLFKQAQESLVGGVNSPVRAYQAVEGHPVFIKQGSGSHVTCEDNQSYIDYVLSYGPLILGHAHPAVLASLAKTMQAGTTFGAPTQLETQLAETIKLFYPYVDKVRFVSSGTEASMSAIRVARGVTKRSILVKFKGCYHGHVGSFITTVNIHSDLVVSNNNQPILIVDYDQGKIGVGKTPDSASEYILDVKGKVNASGYYVNGVSIESVFNWKKSNNNLYYNLGTVGRGYRKKG